MRYTALLLLAASGACDIKPFANALPAHIAFISASVSDTTVSAGGQFVTTARVRYDNCNYPVIDVTYAGRRVEQTGRDALQAPFTAVLGDTAVYFLAYCGFSGGAMIVIYIHVAPSLAVLGVDPKRRELARRA